MHAHDQATLGFIGFGEAASEICLGLRSEGFSALEAYDARQDCSPDSELILQRANEARITLSKSIKELVERSTIVISANSSSAAISVAREAAEFLCSKQLFVDVNAAGPQAMEEASSAIRASGAEFVDVAMMGPIPRSRHKVPILASGDGAIRFAELMTPFGMRIRVLGGAAGQASATKLIRSIFMKGAAALFYELSIPAMHYGVVDLVLEGICSDMDAGPFMDMVTRWISGTAIHAGRRVHEMHDVLALLEQNAMRSPMTQATTNTLEWLAGLGLRDQLGGKLPSDFHDALNALAKLL